MRTTTLVAATLAVVLTAVVAGCREMAAAAPGAVGGREGQQVPAFTLTALDGSKLTPASLKGKIVIVDFWDTWCGPCLRALPHLKELGAAYPDEVVIVAIALGQEGEAKVREVMTRQGLTFPIALLDAQADLTPVFGNIDSLPTTFLIGPDGVIRRRWVGAQSLPTYQNAVKALLPS